MSEDMTESSWLASGPEERSPPASGGIKRIRQACTSCRQKKIKCSGDKPRCGNCRRAMHRCQYEPFSATSAPPSGNASAFMAMMNNSELLQRISVIENRLAALSGQPSQDSSSLSGFDDILENTSHISPKDVQDIPHFGDQVSSSPTEDLRDAVASSRDFRTLPPDSVVEALVDTYFTHSHNQPYSYFHEKTFRQRLSDGLLPKCVVLAVLASALRFSDHEYYQGIKAEAMAAYAREAWLSVLTDHMTADDSPNLHVAQTTNILAIVEFTSGRTSSGWLKIGLAIRIAQDLQLMKEPSEVLSVIEREEQRRCFWSIYLLDKLVSCGKDRHLAINDDDCSVQLPCDEPSFRAGEGGKTLTLHQLLDWNTDLSGLRGSFPLAILAASALGRCTRNVLHDREIDEVPPWDSRSEYASINSRLLLVESRLEMDRYPIDYLANANRLENGGIDHQVMGHTISARIIFHLCHCLLNHPFLLRRRLKGRSCQAPASFFSLSFQKGYEHSRSLVNVLHDAAAAGCHLGASFYAYSACLAGSTLSLNMHADKHKGGQRSSEMLCATQESLGILETMGHFWEHASKMHHRLLSFNAHAHLFTSLFDPQTAPDLGPELETALWSMIDYGAMCRDSPLSIPTPTLSSPSGLHNVVFGGEVPDLSPDVTAAADIDSNAISFDTPSISYLFELASSGG